MKVSIWLSVALNCSVVLVQGMALLLGLVPVARSFDAIGSALNGSSGTLTYKGVVSGSVTFSSADCSFDDDHHMVGFVAPHQDDHHPEIETPGPIIAVAFFEPGAGVNFSTDHIHSTDQNVFMILKKKEGVSYSKKGDNWVVTISDLKMPNLDVMNQKWTTLSGALVCTHVING